MIPLFDLTRQYGKIRKEVLDAIDQVILDGRVILGPSVEKFEKELAEYLDVKHAIGVANGSDALVISLHAIGIEKGEKVVTTPYTFFATASCIVRNGGIPVFVDVEPDTYNIDLNQVEQVLKKEEIKVVIPVHLFGRTVDFEKLDFLKQKFGVKILEDAAQSIGSEGKIGNIVKKSGTFGDIGIFSFFPTKNLGAYGDAGAIVTNDDQLAERARMLRQHGSKKKYYHEMIGYNSRLDSIHAAILSIKLRHLEEWTQRRIEIAKTYQRLFEEKKLPIKYPKVEEKGYRSHVYHQYVVEFEDEKTRDRVRDHLTKNEIGTALYYPLPLHLQKCFAEYGYKQGDFPVAEKLSKTTLALPIFPELTDEEIQFVVEKISEVL
ncbi:Pleiotropic regulatory protein [Fervidobacterium sp. SC_NGM5_O18]|uniref:DegT/DnrJ/EryC1/StrS family aminotransferase n=2 Tax=Fervidobacterium pennivorans TaxID=93466 RepID=A0A172T2E6_FERPE|nr:MULTISPECIES: DegT/DnrJ/EryC1/StrS family aminotransferase [Fervidobacterium]AFG34726.1 putative PLP-dependent enzyme possibly involved in cell wall biogenesis [Fervidobacterium pennivorans DSM 9078]ANE41185.1 Pleiotropic regulatory protein [Fervidobacterium pennivorans]NPU89037.1 DegT/DnrJ/EryC1/StrS family aminotransferase [Fervidobacterium sp.]PHJ12360.1 Pleiotropic regulatory protein [Fervidobacterium sp. SC_NGM5_O18]